MLTVLNDSGMIIILCIFSKYGPGCFLVEKKNKQFNSTV